MQYAVGEEFRGHKYEGYEREHHLQPFGASLPGRDGRPAPGGGGAIPEVTDLPENEEVQDRADRSKDHHGDADGIGMKPEDGRIDAAGNQK